jgi:hypothetical protein
MGARHHGAIGDAALLESMLGRGDDRANAALRVPALIKLPAALPSSSWSIAKLKIIRRR